MIDLTPLDVRKKGSDFRKTLRGYDPEEVEGFLQLAAERLEELVKENLTLRERSERLQEQVLSHEARERAVQDALVMAQQLRSDLTAQAEREAELRRMESDAEMERRLGEADRRVEETRRALEEIERRRLRFLKAFRSLLQRELEAVEVEEARGPLEMSAVELDLGAKVRRSSEEKVRKPVKESAPLSPVDAVEALGDPGEPGRDGLWLSSILKEERAGEGGEEESRA